MIGRPFANGTGFDFAFDFYDTTKLSCTELVYALYREPLGLRRHRVLGKHVFIADDFFKKAFRLVYASPGARTFGIEPSRV